MPDARPALYGTGTFEGTFAVLSLDTNVVAKLLDPALEPAVQQVAPPGRHPVYFQFGRHSEVRGTWPVFRDLPVAYNEALVLVPWVRFRGGTRPFVFMPRLYLDSWWPTFLGRFVFGLAKTRTDVVDEPPAYRVGERRGPPRWTATTTSKAGAPDLAAGAKLLGVFDQPVLAVRELFSRRAELAFWMSFTVTAATAVEVRIDLDDDFLAASGLDRSYRLPGSREGETGSSLRLSADWTMTFPTDDFER